MSTPPQGSQHRRGIVMGYESSPGQLYQQNSFDLFTSVKVQAILIVLEESHKEQR